MQRQVAQEEAALAASAHQGVVQRVQARQGLGEPLPVAVRRHLELGLNADLSRVRVHTDREAAALAARVQARAFTSGPDIYFAANTYDPGSRAGLTLIAHEAAHVVQQQQGRVAAGLDPDAALETEAEQQGERLGHAVNAAPPTAPLSDAAPAGASAHAIPGAAVQRVIGKSLKPKPPFPTRPLRDAFMNRRTVKSRPPGAPMYFNSEYKALLQGLHRKQTRYTVIQALAKADRRYVAKHGNARIKAQNAGTRITTHQALITKFQNNGYATGTLQNKLVTKQHGSAVDALLGMVPFTDQDLVNVSKVGDMYSNFTTHFNKVHAPAMIRTASACIDVNHAMVTADTSASGKFSVSTKGSVFESFVDKTVLGGYGRVSITRQLTMHASRDSDSYDAATRTLYDAKFYDSVMGKSTNNHQYDDYELILSQGLDADGGEPIDHVCYVFPDQAAAQLNVGLNKVVKVGKDIQVAYVRAGQNPVLVHV
ncbi:eCIS core domain-containing protein [Deinococcus radiotolerans]|uniref:eCIS core domain-containing protein n=1 Tax=Deinococcus radiotolerans TaxID=1309407 RepID=A0ABQ2FMU0_9DEIO|nr:DUF4157 domain-containing protein [Deinococcus radiotolerans]GGL08223.1 hypothetical protein GCM10010844_28770 [Deinococcus radiotolerans]